VWWNNRNGPASRAGWKRSLCPLWPRPRTKAFAYEIPPLAIARYTFLQQFRNRLYLVVVLFGLLMVAASLLFGALAGDQEVRVILDLGLVTAEIFALATAVFGAVTLVVEEMESKTIYLILDSPVPKPVYVLGRFLGLLLAVGASLGGYGTSLLFSILP
jgi:ABC-type transport system involved in multi-copper enzyme maturation permease subunit